MNHRFLDAIIVFSLRGDSSVDGSGKIAKAGRFLVKYDHLRHTSCASGNVQPPVTPKHKGYPLKGTE